MTPSPEVEAAAAVAMAGMDAMRYLHGADPVEAAAMAAVAKRVRDVRKLRDEDQAVRIANAVWGAVNG